MAVFKNFLAGRQAAQDEESQGIRNALYRSQVERIPQQRALEDQQFRLNEQSIASNAATMGAQQQGNARGIAARHFAAVAQSQDPLKAGQMLLSNPEFQAAAKASGLDLAQLTITPQDTADTIRSQSMDIARALGAPGLDAMDGQPASVKEFQYAKKNGYTGSFQDWVVAGGQSSRPSSVQEWDFYQKLPDDQKRIYLEMKRNPNMSVKDIAGAPSVVAPTVVGGTSVTPLSSAGQENDAAQARKAAEAVGAAEGAVQGGIVTKGANAVGAINLLDLADPLIDVATGSATGTARDAVAGFFGASTGGGEAIAQLKVLQAGLMTQMPRMEGPQSDADVKLYREAAGQIGDPQVPAPIKKAAVQTIRKIQQKYIERAGGTPQQGQTGGGAAPEGTVVQNAQGQRMVKRGGKWVAE
jgi:hypothetical protein